MIWRIIFACVFVLTASPHSLFGDEKDAFGDLYDVLMVRHALNGVAFGENEIAPMIFKFSAFPFDDGTYPRLRAVLTDIKSDEIETLSVAQRAILQRQVWAIFDATTPSRFVTRRPHEERRNAVRQQLADLIRSLALKKSEILTLPLTLRATVEAKKYPTRFDLDKPTSPFLPSELSEDSSAWICFGRSGSPVTFHASESGWRSVFFQFVRLPSGRDATIDYIDDWKKDDVFPVGTQVALIEKAFLVSDEGEIVLSPMTVGVQLRAYRNVEQHIRDAGSATQCVAEFISRPRDYIRGDALMVTVRATGHRLKVLMTGGKHDVLELVRDPKTSAVLRLKQCMNCHGGAGTSSLGDVVVPRGKLKTLQQRSQTEITEATMNAKRADDSWKLLRNAWNKGTR